MFRTHFDGNVIQSYGALTNLILSDRSDGKTFDIKAKGFIRWLKDKSQYVYLRRWKSEIVPEMYTTFYDEVVDAVVNNTLTAPNSDEKTLLETIVDYEFLGTKTAVYVRQKGTKTWDTICYLLPLTMTAKKKSVLSIKRISHIEYDEFVALDGRYFKSEMPVLMEFYKSVDRDRDKTILNLYGNRIDNFNPFFDFFNIHLGIQKEKIRLYKNGTVAVQIYVNQEHRQERQKSRFNTMVENTLYDDYNNGGTLYTDVVKISNINGCHYFSSFKTELGAGSIYINDNKVVISSKQRKDGSCIVDRIYNLGRKEYVCTFGNIPTWIKHSARTGQLYYDSELTYHCFEPILNKIGGLK